MPSANTVSNTGITLLSTPTSGNLQNCEVVK